MSVWVKICGNTSLDDAQLAVEHGADALGFIFAPSPRQISPADAASMIATLRSSPSVAVEYIGVFQDVPLEEILQTAHRAGLSGIQLHGQPDPVLIRDLRHALPKEMPIIQTLHWVHGQSPEHLLDTISGQIEELRTLVDRYLIDSRVGGALGGTGKTFDWHHARELFRSGSGLKGIAAGGLNPENVQEAIQQLKPWGVDVASGVEQSPGRKEAGRLELFIRRARAAAQLTA